MSVDHQWLEVPCQRTATDSQFSAGIQDYVFSVGAPNVFFPSKSYMRYQLPLLVLVGRSLRLRLRSLLPRGALRTCTTTLSSWREVRQ